MRVSVSPRVSLSRAEEPRGGKEEGGRTACKPIKAESHTASFTPGIPLFYILSTHVHDGVTELKVGNNEILMQPS